MQSEWESAGRVLGDGLGHVVDTVSQVHEAMGQRVESWLPARMRPRAAAHRARTGRWFDAVAGANRRIPEKAGRLAAVGLPRSGVADSRVGHRLLPVVNGLWGDRLASRGESLAFAMSVRSAGVAIPLTAADLRTAFPQATGHLVVFLHGLFETERDWSWQEPGEVATSYAEQLQECLPVTSIQIRYNTGLRISENGRHLAELLDALVPAWPVPVVSISLVGHSMGGLVARSACHAGQREGADWASHIRSVVTLGSPHLGSPVEKAVHLADWALRKVPELEPLGRLVAARSVGIKDLRFGAVVEEDWHGHDPDEFLRDRCTEIPFLEGTDYYWVAASLTRDPDHPLGQLIGDGLVRLASASGNGRSRSVPLDLERGLHVTGASHFALMRHEAVFAQLRRWLEPRAVAG